MKTEHIGGLLKIRNSEGFPTIVDCEGNAVCLMDSRGALSSGEEIRGNANRIVDCWNALEGIADPSVVSELLKLAEEIAENFDHHKHDPDYDEPLVDIEECYKCWADNLMTKAKEKI